MEEHVLLQHAALSYLLALVSRVVRLGSARGLRMALHVLKLYRDAELTLSGLLLAMSDMKKCDIARTEVWGAVLVA